MHAAPARAQAFPPAGEGGAAGEEPAFVKFGRTLESQVARLGRGRTVTPRPAATGSCGLRLVARSLPVGGSPGMSPHSGCQPECAPRIWVIWGNGACRATLPPCPLPTQLPLANLAAASNNVYRRALSLPY